MLLAAGVLASCGGGDQADGRAAATATPAAAQPEEPAATAAPAARRPARLARVGSFEEPVFLTSPPGDRRRQFVVEQGGRVMILRDGAQARHAVPRHRLARDRGRRAGAAVARVRARLRAEPAVLRLLHRRAGRPAGRRVPGPRRRARRRRIGPPRAADARRRGQPQRRPAPLRPRPPALHRHRRRRRRRRPAREPRQRPGPGLAAGQDPADRPAGGERARVLGSVVEPVHRAAPAPAPRSTATGCATRGGSRSTAGPGTSRSATSGRTPTRRSTGSAAAAAAGRTSAGARSRAARATRRASRRRATCRP